MAAAALPVASSWYREETIAAGVVRIDEPHVDPFLRSNIWHVRGRDRDLVFDAGLGVTSLRAALPHVFARSPVLVVSHAHLDHVGSAHEFDDRRGASAVSPLPVPASLRGPELTRLLGLGGSPLADLLIDAVPRPGFDVHAFEVPPLVLTTRLGDGDEIDLGDQRWTVLHLPGHTPDSLCLLQEATGVLLSGDVVYDDELLDVVDGADPDAYVRSLLRLDALDVTTVLPGHGDPFGADQLRTIVRAYVDGRLPSPPGPES